MEKGINNYKWSKGENMIIKATNFRTYASCSTSLKHPVIDEIENSITIPVSSNIPIECTLNYLDAISKSSYNLSRFSFYGIFNGGNTAPSSTEEMAIFVGKNIITWDEEEFGFTYTNNDHTLKAYTQGKDEFGQKFFNYVVIESNIDNNEHLFSAKVRQNSPNIIDFYIDNILKGTINSNITVSYSNINYYFVGTTHRNFK